MTGDRTIFGEVSETKSRVLIVASGSSLKDFNWSNLKITSDIAVIAVNGSVKFLAAATHWMTVDPSPVNRFLMANQVQGVKYYAAVPDDYGTPSALDSEMRKPAEVNVTFLKRITGNGPLKATFGLSEQSDRIHTGNSAYGAFGIAYLMGASKVAILGVDGYGVYWYGSGTSVGSLEHLNDLFSSTIKQLNTRRVAVVNGSVNSKVQCFPRVEPFQAVEWLTK